MEVMYWADVISFQNELNELEPMAAHGEKLWQELRIRVIEHVRLLSNAWYAN
mgnify:CR=1 FL=1